MGLKFDSKSNVWAVAMQGKRLDLSDLREIFSVLRVC